jgi:sulfite exporter TauE/SafE
VNVVWIPIVIASLAGSLHCAAMCGPFSAAVCGVGAEGRVNPLNQVAYHLGRLLTYLGLATAAGLLGSALDLAGSAAGIGSASAFVAGGLLVIWGVSTLFAERGLVSLKRRAPRRLGALLGSTLTRVRGLPPLPRAFALGLSTTLLPCGWLYAFVATAAGSGGVAPALGVLSAFWLGTIPALVTAGVGLRGLTTRLGEHARVATASLIVVSGVVVLALRAGAEPASAARAAAPPRGGPGMAGGMPVHGQASNPFRRARARVPRPVAARTAAHPSRLIA